MQKFSTWLILSFAVVFWILRVAAAYNYSLGLEFMIKPLDLATEIMLLFVALISFIFIAKRRWLGPIIYAIGYCGYFGVYVVNILMKGNGIPQEEYYDVFFSMIGIVLSLISIIDLALDANRKAHPKDKKTDWFYKDKKYDREFDERADKNNYRTL